MMYRTHCQRILDTVIRANFDEVQSFLLHFWQGMPGHIQSILECKTIITLVGVCDSILYKAIASVLMPTVLQALPDSLTQVIRNFAKQLDEWLSVALDSLPENLQKVKFDLSRRFSQVLKRQTSLNHLCQAARTVIHSSDITSQMLEDWLNVDLNSIIKQTLYTMDNYNDVEYHSIIKLSGDFEALLEDQAPLESYIEWLDKMVDKCVVQPSRKHPGSLRRRARQFLLMWSCFGTRIIRDMTLHSAPSFGSFHLLHLMFDDYVLYLVESLHSQERHQEFLRAVKGEENVDILDDIALPDPSRIRESLSRLQEKAVTTESQPERGSVITNTRETLANVTGNVGGSRTNNLSGHLSQLTHSPHEEDSAMNEDFVDQSQNTSYGNVNPAYRSLASFPSFGQPLYSTQSTFRTQSSADMECFSSYSDSGPQAQIGQLPYFDNQTLEKPNSNPSGLAMYDWQQRPLPVSGINSSTGRLSDGKDYSAFTNPTRLSSVESLNYGYFESSQREASCSVPNVLQATSQNIYGLYL
ncbi:hypothetical protein CHS0354_013908 [Potamilus streckersoni]|uniref:RFX1-4/6/8-like BCD domain-containing protein n=1 Tax=Potamilus streckersoni TaxID=2493646 RepID=A0AAE0RX08_9BIVA|nr:hypothetical protein CHS0354_013908 [Potamilus streckersoni]